MKIIATIVFLLFYVISFVGERSQAAKFSYDLVLLWKVLYQRAGSNPAGISEGSPMVLASNVRKLWSARRTSV